MGSQAVEEQVRASSRSRLSAKALKRLGQLRRLGPLGLARTAYVASIAPTAFVLTDPMRELARRRHRQRVLTADLASRLERLNQRVPAALRPDAGPLLHDLDPEADARIAHDRKPGEELVIGQFDQDGGILAAAGPIRGLPCMPEDQFMQREKYRVQLVDLGGRLGVRKEFGAAIGRFVQELEAMLDLAAAGCAVPPVMHVDWKNNTITSAFVHGDVVRELLAKAGARIRDREVGHAKAREDRIRSARSVMPGVLTSEQISSIADALLEIHHAGYVLEDVKYGNIILEEGSGRPIFVDFERALPLAGLSRNMSIYLRDIDRRKFNEHFGTDLLTAASLRSLDAPPGAKGEDGEFGWFEGVYAPAIVRDDIRWGPVWNTDLGIGRWNFIMKQHLPIPEGGTVLDLGANNGFNALQMLRSGARSAVGVEIDPRAIRQGSFLKQSYEWADNRVYDFRYVHGSHAELAKHGLPRFDMVSALCTLYYVSEQEMADTVRYIRSLTDLLVLQCNTDRLIDRTDEATFRKASLEFAIQLMEQAGFSNRQVIAPPGYSRPLVIGRA